MRKRKTVTFSLEDCLIDLLRLAADDQNMSVSRLVENTLKEQFMPKEAKNV